jgi:hypothetical protein
VKIKSQKDFWSGAMFMAFGVAFAWGASTYSIGTGAKMGPGYFPLMLGVLLAVLGAVIALKALSVETADGDPIGKWAWKPLFLVLAAVCAFGFLIVGVRVGGVKTPEFGMVIAIFVMTILASLASEFKLRDVLILASALSIFSYLVFVVALKLPFPMVPNFPSAAPAAAAPATVAAPTAATAPAASDPASATPATPASAPASN